MRTAFSSSWLPFAVVLAVLSSATVCNAQGWCGTEVLPEHVELVETLTEDGFYDPLPDGMRSSSYVPLSFHVVRRDDGTGGLSDARLVKILDGANLYFANSGVRFCWQGPVDYIDSDFFYSGIATIEDVDILRTTNVVPNTVNIYFVESLSVDGNALCGISSFTWSEVQGIVIANPCTEPDNQSVVPHEIGHYFDLLHTHETAWGAECVSGYNCHNAGDFLCDTPADPNLLGKVDSSCGYTGNDRDPCDDVPYQPDTTNLMAYSEDACQVIFTDQQHTRMQATLQRLRPELMGASCPGDNEWILRGKLLASDGQAGDQLGDSAGISGDLAVVGASLDDDRGNAAGSAFIYQRAGSVWTQAAKLLAGDGASLDQFGLSAAIDGNTAVIGAPYDDDRGSASGSAYVFEKIGGVWQLVTKLVPADGSAADVFGNSVAVSGDMAIVGAQQDDDLGAGSGSAYVYQKTGGLWRQVAKLVASDGAVGDQFGYSVAISGARVLVGAPADDDGGSTSGSAYVFEKVADAWTEVAKLHASDAAAGSNLGASVALDGTTAVIGAPWDDASGADSGAAYVFEKIADEWVETAKVVGFGVVSNDRFGYSVSVSADTAVIGAPFHDDPDRGIDSGSAHVFRNIGGVWTVVAKLLGPDGAAGDQFGTSVGVSGDTAVVGAHGHNALGDNSGAAYVFQSISALRGCAPDINQDGVVDTRDFIGYLNLWATQDPDADWNSDGMVDTRDFIAFLNEWGDAYGNGGHCD